MDELDRLYVGLLHYGLIIVKNYAAVDVDWLRAEVELLHNVPSLIGESNWKRHEFFWHKERSWYLKWLSAHGSELAEQQMRTFYEPIWKEMRIVLAQKFGISDAEEAL